ncbi:DUF2480 family protein [Mesonia sp. MT50]|uniref:DUF2480 family protein n=1 Tax=Mesonia profundi TaxID=3070998 RepID=A0ABU0ZY47_9FLAO|nr:DUF2480 family protein [Mesonia profundi]MDQ7916332.1 DUF2480 family protein [Mesonia profundi]
MDEIINKVANSKLITVNLEDYYLAGNREQIDISQWLYEGFVLREKEFRATLKEYDWSVYNNTLVALSCSTDAIIPSWAYILITTYLQPYAKKIVVGDLPALESILYAEKLQQEDWSHLKDKMVIIKGCSSKPVPENAYLLLAQYLQPMVKSLMFGEACSSVPLYKKPKLS